MESSFALFAGSSHQELAVNIAKSLQINLGSLKIERFPDGEIGVEILNSVRGRDVFVLQAPARRPNHYLMELLIVSDALKRASARSIIAVMPYFPYARQDRKDKGRVPITARLVADLLEKAGVTRLLTMDLHTDQIQGFFNIPVDNLSARSLLVQEVRRFGWENGIVVSPDVGSNRMARKFAEDLKVDLAIVDKRRLSAEQVDANALIGSVKGKNVLLIDDMCSTGGTLTLAAQVCRKEGAAQVCAAVTHGLFVGSRLPHGIDRFFATDSVPPLESWGGKVQIVSLADYLAEAMRCMISRGSISSLFNREGVRLEN